MHSVLSKSTKDTTLLLVCLISLAFHPKAHQGYRAHTDIWNNAQETEQECVDMDVVVTHSPKQLVDLVRQ